MSVSGGYMRSDLRTLIELQTLDSEMDRLRAGIRRARNDPELAALRDRTEVAHITRDEIKERLTRLRHTAASEEAESDQLRAKVKEMERKMYGGEVASVKELDQMQRRVEEYRAKIGQHDEAGLTAMAAAEEVEPCLAESAEALKDITDALALAEKKRRNTVNDLQRRLDELEPQRAAKTARLPGPLLKKYEQIRDRRGGVGAAALGPSGLCGACLVKVPLVLAKSAQEGVLETCESCGRLVVYVEETPD